ncbi:MAG: UDP-3-O-acyl-N-acetylglucosamine deacetylase, partial [Rhodospirillales bacterium]
DHGARIGTVEHLMAALLGCRIDNVIVDVEGPEIPIMDGSAAPFVFLVECAGTVEQQAPRRAIEILKPVTVGDDRRSATLAPGRAFSVSFEIDFDSPLVSTQRLSVDFANGAFRTEICRARTFGFEHEVAELRTLGYARGGSLDNAIVIGGDGILNEDGLRYRDEFVRHKILDSAGDLYLAGAPICGHFHGHRSGHTLNNKLLKAVFADATAWRTVPLTETDRPAEGDPEDGSPETFAASA